MNGKNLCMMMDIKDLNSGYRMDLILFKKIKISKPFYWINENFHFTLRGTQKIFDTFPVTNISFYEANAFAKWKKKRLPTEFEIEFLLKKF